MGVPRAIDAGEQIEGFFGREIADVRSQLGGDQIDVVLRVEAEMIERADQIDQIASRVIRQVVMDLVAEDRDHVLLESSPGQLHAARIAKQETQRGGAVELLIPRADVVANAPLQFGRNDAALHIGAINEDQLERRHSVNERAEGIRHFGKTNGE